MTERLFGAMRRETLSRGGVWVDTGGRPSVQKGNRSDAVVSNCRSAGGNRAAGAGARTGGAAVGRDCGGRGAQWAGVRGVSGARRTAGAGAGKPEAGRGSVHDRGAVSRALSGREDVTVRVSGGAAAPEDHRGTRFAGAGISLDAGGEWAVRAVPRRRERAALGRRTIVRSGDPAVFSWRSGGLARDERLPAAAAGCASSRGRGGHVDRGCADAAGDRCAPGE